MIPTNLAEFIKDGLARARIDQRDLAERSGVSEVTISRIKNGHSGGTMRTLNKLRPFLSPPVEPVSDGEGREEHQEPSNVSMDSEATPENGVGG